MIFSKPVNLGVDVGHHSVKLALLSPQRKEILDLAEVEALPDREFLEDTGNEQKMIEAIRKGLEKFSDPRSKTRPRIKSTLPGESAVCRYMELPKMDSQKLQVAVETKMTKLVPFSMESAVTTHLQVPPISEEKGQSGVFFIAFKKDELKNRQSLMQKVGVDVQNFELQCLSAIRQFLQNHPRTPERTVALVLAGSRLTSVIILKNGNPYNIRTFTLGGSNFTCAFQMGRQSTWRDAEEYKQNYDASKREIAIEPVLSKWMDQVRKSIESFIKQAPGKNHSIEKIYLTGGAALMKGLDARLGEFVKIPVTIEFWENVRLSENLAGYPAGTYGVALGVSL